MTCTCKNDITGLKINHQAFRNINLFIDHVNKNDHDFLRPVWYL